MFGRGLVAIVLCSALRGDSGEFFESKIRPVLVARCMPCHSSQAAQPQGALVLDRVEGIRRGGNSGALFRAGDPDASLLMRALRHDLKDLKMPPGKPLDAEIVRDFESWIRAGAALPEDRKEIAKAQQSSHWAFRKPQESPPPSVQNAAWPRGTIDRFILAKLEQKGLAPSPAADRRTLIRRVTLDLTGLPPSFDEIEEFVKDPRANAYERLVERLLASPRYGERWGRHWLDVARYSDARNTGDRFAFSYTYRDWVIRALNEDMPYNEFLRQQIAADRIQGNEPRHLAALGYLSLGREFPKNYPETVDDRIDVVTRGMLGITVACARCHDHKYDPIPTQDYYSLYAVLANLREPEELPLLGRPGERTERDAVYEDRLKRIRETDAAYRKKRSAEMNRFFKEHTADYIRAARDSRRMSNVEREELVRDRQLNLHVLGRWLRFAERRSLELPADAGVEALARRLMEDASLGEEAPWEVPLGEFPLVYTEGDGNNTRRFENRFDAMRAMYAYETAAPRAMALEDTPVIEKAHVFVRGNPNNPGAETPPGFPRCLSEGEPRVFTDGAGRLELANAIASNDNPLTARVIVNRVWMHHFGAGLVRTPSDFGLRGDPPTHPELLDTLATGFMRDGWQIKKLHRAILLSSAYRQSSGDNLQARKLDAENQLLWRMNRRRLDVESLRDGMLSAAGQIDLRAGGPPYSLTTLPAVPRRTVYGFVERGRVAGFLAAFDFASPDTHAPMRYTTTVPQQALYLLNSPFAAAQARSVASLAASGAPAERVRTMYRRVLGRDPNTAETEAGVGFIRDAAPVKAEAPAASPWHYGFGEYDGAKEAVIGFNPFQYFTGDAWQGASMLPDRATTTARLRADGGEPGDGPTHVTIRRWTSPIDGKVSIEGTLRHRQDTLGAGDGVRGRIVSGKAGMLASAVANGSAAEIKLSEVRVSRGETIDFVVDCRDDNENDAFTWAPVIREGDRVWNAQADFGGPAAASLTAWELFAQTLLSTNEFAFVD